jgi:hypothetical protein
MVAVCCCDARPAGPQVSHDAWPIMIKAGLICFHDAVH